MYFFPSFDFDRSHSSSAKPGRLVGLEFALNSRRDRFGADPFEQLGIAEISRREIGRVEGGDLAGNGFELTFGVAEGVYCSGVRR